MDLSEQLRDKIADLIGFYTEGLSKLELQYISDRIIKDAFEPFLEDVKYLDEAVKEINGVAH